MTADAKDEAQLDRGLRPCTPEEAAQARPVHDEHAHNVAHFLAHRDELIRNYPDKFVLIYCDADGVSKSKVDRLPALLNDRDNTPSAMIEWLGFELRA